MLNKNLKISFFYRIVGLLIWSTHFLWRDYFKTYYFTLFSIRRFFTIFYFLNTDNFIFKHGYIFFLLLFFSFAYRNAFMVLYKTQSFWFDLSKIILIFFFRFRRIMRRKNYGKVNIPPYIPLLLLSRYHFSLYYLLIPKQNIFYTRIFSLRIRIFPIWGVCYRFYIYYYYYLVARYNKKNIVIKIKCIFLHHLRLSRFFLLYIPTIYPLRISCH